MSWYRTGTVAVTNGSTTVTGTGTAWVANAIRGQGIILPDGRTYEIAAVVSDTQITLGAAYLGSTASGQPYVILPTRGPELALVREITQLVADFGAAFLNAGQGRFGDGSLAAPGMRFIADENTGFNRPGADQIGAVTNGILRWLLSNTAFQVNVPITGVAVTQSATDTTAGRLLKVGDFGLGRTTTGGGLFTGDLDTLSASGFYAITTGATSPSSPGLTFGAGDHILHLQWGAGAAFQMYFDIAATGVHRTFQRQQLSNAWSPWREIYNAATLLGTVSQSGGVPTGRLRENVSNANGRAERDFSGSMECWRHDLSAANANTALGSRFRSADVTWTFPSSFLSGTVPVVTASVIDADCDVRLVSVSNTQAVFRIISDVSKGSAITFQARAKGRWSDMT